MGEKKKQRKYDWECQSCRFKGLKDDLREKGYLYDTKIGDVIDCPKCDLTQKVER